jgi:hypothetical protein
MAQMNDEEFEKEKDIAEVGTIEEVDEDLCKELEDAILSERSKARERMTEIEITKARLIEL